LKVYLMRHGEALHPAVDPEMRLSERGLNDARRMGDYLMSLRQPIDSVWHSPKARARQTAQCVAEAIQFDAAGLELRRDITPEGDSELVFNSIESARESGRLRGLLIVSHMPFLPQLAGKLTGGSARADFETASVMALSAAGGVWELQWFKAPAQL